MDMLCFDALSLIASYLDGEDVYALALTCKFAARAARKVHPCLFTPFAAFPIAMEWVLYKECGPYTVLSYKCGCAKRAKCGWVARGYSWLVFVKYLEEHLDWEKERLRGVRAVGLPINIARGKLDDTYRLASRIIHSKAQDVLFEQCSLEKVIRWVPGRCTILDQRRYEKLLATVRCNGYLLHELGFEPNLHVFGFKCIWQIGWQSLAVQTRYS